MSIVIRRSCNKNCHCSKCRQKKHKELKKRQHSPKQHHLEQHHSSSSSGEDCEHREFRDHSDKLRAKLGKIQYKHAPHLPRENAEEIKYKNYNYNGSFHKSLQHNDIDGRLEISTTYELMRNAILKNDQVTLASIPLATGASIKLNNPLSSWATILIGVPQSVVIIDDPPALSSASAAAEMVEVYCLALSRDVPFINFSTDSSIAIVLDTNHLNSANVLANLQYYMPMMIPFTSQTLFRGITISEKFGPYVSQLLLVDIPYGTGHNQQKYITILPRPNICEVGTNLTQTIDIQNGNLGSLPTPNVDPVQRYIFSGRSLSELVHNDSGYQLWYQAAIILIGLGAVQNPGWPVYPNQSGFITDFGMPTVLCSMAGASDLALKHAYYQKWQKYRRLRPEVFGLWVHDIQTGLVANADNFDISNVLLGNSILNDIFGLYGNYTLPLCYKEGSPVHPDFCEGHGAISGSCATVLKIYFNAGESWSSLPGVISGALSNLISGPVEADVSGSLLQSYSGADVVGMTINGEINKMCSNIAIGRCWSGVHYRSSAIVGLLLGENVAIKYMEDILSSLIENNLNRTVPTITITKFDGTSYTLKLTICKNN